MPPLGWSVELNAPVSEVTVCVAGSLFVHFTLSPMLIVTETGLKAKFATATLCVAAFGAALAAVVLAARGSRPAARPSRTADPRIAVTIGSTSGGAAPRRAHRAR